jgi:hypothetical protein
MDLKRPVGALATLLVVFTAFGAAASLVTGPVVGQNALPAIAVLALVAVSVVVATVVGVRSREWLESGGYW